MGFSFSEIFLKKKKFYTDLLSAVHAGGGGPVPGLPLLPLPAAARPGLDALPAADWGRHWCG